MAFVNRRGFLKLISSTTSLVLGFNIFSNSNYQVKYIIKLDKDMNKEFYHNNRHKWEKVDHIREVNDRYRNTGQLISIEKNETDESIEWVYLFKTKKDYKLWNYEVYFSGAFNHSKIPRKNSLIIEKNKKSC